MKFKIHRVTMKQTIRKSTILGVLIICLLQTAILAMGNTTKTTLSMKRQTINLDRVWQIEQGDTEDQPEQFTHTVIVPGLVDLSEPAFEQVGQKSPLRQAFWYRRTFTVKSHIPDVAIIKLNKLKFGSKIYLNGKLVGLHPYNFTPAFIDVKDTLNGKGQLNELVICLGANRNNPLSCNQSGWDFEKYRYIPGIYDSVELILTGSPYIENVQVAPQIENSSIHVQTQFTHLSDSQVLGPIEYIVREYKTNKIVAQYTQQKTAIPAGNSFVENVTIPIRDAQLWSPESPFLYCLEVHTVADTYSTRFGMREFLFDPVTKKAMLNGKVYYLRGSNITLHRFFEDTERGTLPWDREWVRALHQKLKDYHWNSLRYCIGFPPEFWYEIADEEGILIQDEFPVWTLNTKKNTDHKELQVAEYPLAEELIPQYSDWMHERWNHPCVVIWDAQNESQTPETGKALSAVRHLDLSNRPWDNGWGQPQSDTDIAESHPYFFGKGWKGGDCFFDVTTLSEHDGVPSLQKEQKTRDVPIIINEYSWLWLDRQGNPTSLTKRVYDALLPDSTPEQKRLFWARSLAALTEFWRSHRKCAGVLHFCTLGYSRPGDLPRPEGGATSDHFSNVAKLEFQKEFLKYVPDAFSPVGVMIDLWAPKFPVSKPFEVPVVLINDFNHPVKGELQVRLLQNNIVMCEKKKPFQIDALGKTEIAFKLDAPDEPIGKYEVIAELNYERKSVKSYRYITFIADDMTVQEK